MRKRRVQMVTSGMSVRPTACFISQTTQQISI